MAVLRKAQGGANTTGTRAAIRFDARLLRPEAAPGRAWSFILLPKVASAEVPSRGLVSVVGTPNGHSFRATLEPDGQKGHWFKVSVRLRATAGVAVGEMVTLELHPLEREPPTRVPPDLRRALAAAPRARALWLGLTARARRDWIQWIGAARRSETRARRIRNTCEMLIAGKRRVCCFDVSGFYSKGLTAPKPAE